MTNDWRLSAYGMALNSISYWAADVSIRCSLDMMLVGGKHRWLHVGGRMGAGLVMNGRKKRWKR